MTPDDFAPASVPPPRTGFQTLRIANGADAEMRPVPGRPGVHRVEIREIGTGVRHDIQVSVPIGAVRAGERCTVCVIARADADRPAALGCSRDGEPWDNLGWYEAVSVTTTWQAHTWQFTASMDCAAPRVHLDLGEAGIPVEFAGLTVHSLDDGRAIHVAGGTPGRDPGPDDEETTVPPPGAVDLGDLRRTRPISSRFGRDRGTPIDRYYIEAFLAEHADRVRGDVLEVGDDGYTRRFGGGRVTRSDVLHVNAGAPGATIIADLADAPQVGSDRFDCIVLTQTLQLIYDLRAAVRTIHRILRPGGTLLATFPGISQSYDPEWGAAWCWGLTATSAQRLFEEAFGPAATRVRTRGSVVTAVAFLHGLAREELTREELERLDPAYPVSITVVAAKR